MLKIAVNQGTGNTTEVEVERDGKSWSVDGKSFNGDIVKTGTDSYHVLWNNRSYTIQLLGKSDNGNVNLQINGRVYETKTKDELSQLLEHLGMNSVATQKVNNMKAPMPGLIQAVSVSEGDAVKTGDTLLVLVAMKMENAIKASGEGIVKSLKVIPGQAVEKGQVLLEFQ